MRRSPGIALLVVVGVLGILAVLAAAFVTLAQLERRASTQRLNSTKAALLARSGIEDALARLSAGQEAAYGGEDWALDGYDPYDQAQEVFGPGVLDLETCPVRHALRPTWFKRDGTGKPWRTPVEGRERGHSGELRAGSAYVLKVEDESAKINVNGGFLDGGDRDNNGTGDGIPDHRDPDVRVDPADPKDTGLGWNFQLARILGILGQQPEVGIPTLGTDVLQNRPQGGYGSVTELQQRIGTSKDLSPFLTTSSWIDDKVVHPNAYDAQPGQVTWSGVKLTRAPLLQEPGGRAPVNLNAASRPVLAALLEGLAGICWQTEQRPVPRALTAPQAAAVADTILAARPFGTWGGFATFCDALAGPFPAPLNGFDTGHWGGGNLDAADLIKSNFDPNLITAKQLPDQILFRWVDKSDLTIWSTEGSLGPTGAFRIAAVGRILGARGDLLAEASASAEAGVFSLLRHTTQKDFTGNRPLQDYLSLAAATHHTTGASNPSWKTWAGSQGLAVMTYPCPPSAVVQQRDSDIEGILGLATVEMPRSLPAGALKISFLHHVDDAWDADLGGDLQQKGGPTAASLQPDVTEAVWPATPGVEPSTFYPDGMHAQRLRAPAFQAAPNLPPPGPGPFPTNHGALGFWVKPHKAHSLAWKVGE
jgi:hypothetical protein